MDNSIQLYKIIEQYNRDDDFLISESYPDGGVNNLFSRLERAAINQLSGGDATASRYAIWANTVRDHIRQAWTDIEEGNEASAKQLMINAANSLSAFSDIQVLFDHEIKD